MKKLLVLAAVLIGTAAWLVRTGLHFNKLVPPQMNDFTLRFGSVYVPFILAFILVGAIAYLGYSQLGMTIEVASSGVILNRRGQCTTVGWGTMVVHRPPAANLMSSALISDGERHIRIQRFFWPEYDELLDRVERTLKQARQAKTVKM